MSMELLMECPLYPTVDASKGDDIKSAYTHMHGSAYSYFN
jgi:hypothetical protein